MVRPGAGLGRIPDGWHAGRRLNSADSAFDSYCKQKRRLLPGLPGPRYLEGRMHDALAVSGAVPGGRQRADPDSRRQPDNQPLNPDQRSRGRGVTPPAHGDATGRSGTSRHRTGDGDRLGRARRADPHRADGTGTAHEPLGGHQLRGPRLLTRQACWHIRSLNDHGRAWRPTTPRPSARRLQATEDGPAALAHRYRRVPRQAGHADRYRPAVRLPDTASDKHAPLRTPSAPCGCSRDLEAGGTPSPYATAFRTAWYSPGLAWVHAG